LPFQRSINHPTPTKTREVILKKTKGEL